jgi:Holliday junction DNA helicase RuvA
MIGRLVGTLAEQKDGLLLIDVGGVGYRVRISSGTLLKLPKLHERVILLTHLAVREDSLDLYGFIEEEELHLFELLLTVPGIGPKSAIAILSIADPKTILSAISEGNSSYLTKVSGIGRKIADKIVLELRDKIGSFEKVPHAGVREEDADVLEALKSLGYQTKEAREALQGVSKETLGASERLKAALKALGR